MDTNEFQNHSYYESPNICQWCKKIIPLKSPAKLAETRIKKFCTRSCSAKHANSKNKKDTSRYTEIDQGSCVICGVTIFFQPFGNVFKIKYRCEKHSHTKIYISRDKKGSQLVNTYKKLKLTPKELAYMKLTKKDLYEKIKPQTAARTSIGSNAVKIYRNSCKPKECLKCGYTKHVEVCHIKAVSEFLPEALVVNEINNIENLIALCPNHHWEFDNGYLNLDILKGNPYYKSIDIE